MRHRKGDMRANVCLCSGACWTCTAFNQPEHVREQSKLWKALRNNGNRARVPVCACARVCTHGCEVTFVTR